MHNTKCNRNLTTRDHHYVIPYLVNQTKSPKGIDLGQINFTLGNWCSLREFWSNRANCTCEVPSQKNIFSDNQIPPVRSLSLEASKKAIWWSWHMFTSSVCAILLDPQRIKSDSEKSKQVQGKGWRDVLQEEVQRKALLPHGAK